jgi:hypothetical protein
MFGSWPSPAMTTLRILIFAFALGLKGALAQLNNPGFEGRYLPVSSSKPTTTGSIAEGWSDNSGWADVTVHYGRDTTDPHSGTSCQKVVLQAVRTGEFQLVQELPGKAGHLYTPGLWLRGTPGRKVNLRFTLSGPPYTVFEDVPVTLDGAWRFASIPSHLTQTAPVTFMIDAAQPVTFCIDDASLSDVPGPVTPSITRRPSLPAFGMHINNYLDSKGPSNLDFEGPFRLVNSPRATITGQLGQHWFDNSDWADVTVHYAANTRSPHGGRAAQRLILSNIGSGSVQAAQFAYLRLGETYSASLWFRGTPGMQMSFALRQWAAPYTDYAAQSLIANGSWQLVTVRGKVTNPGVSVLMVQVFSLGTVDFDDAQLLDLHGQIPNLSLPWPAAPIGAWRLWDQGTTWANVEPGLLPVPRRPVTMVRARRRSRRTSMIGFAVCKRLPLATAAGFSITRFGMSPTMPPSIRATSPSWSS